MTAKLKLVTSEPQPVQTYAQIGQEAHRQFAGLKATIRRADVTFSGAFTTTVKRDAALRELDEAERLIRATRNALRSGA